jgi:hypothetical protein
MNSQQLILITFIPRVFSNYILHIYRCCFVLLLATTTQPLSQYYFDLMAYFFSCEEESLRDTYEQITRTYSLTECDELNYCFRPRPLNEASRMKHITNLNGVLSNFNCVV